MSEITKIDEEKMQLEVESAYGAWEPKTAKGERMNQPRLMQIFEVQDDPILSAGTSNLIAFLIHSAKDEAQKELIDSVCAYIRSLKTEMRELANEVLLANDWTKTYEEREQKRAIENAAPDLLAANAATIQCITDFLECYKNGCALTVMDEAVKSLKDDALKLSIKARAKANGE